MEEIDLYNYLYNLDPGDIIYLLKSNNYIGNNQILLGEAINTLLDYTTIDLYLPFISERTRFRDQIIFKRRKGTLYYRFRGARRLKPIPEKKIVVYDKPDINDIKKDDEPVPKIIAEEINDENDTIEIKTDSLRELTLSKTRNKSIVEEIVVQENDGIAPDKNLSYVDKANIILKPYPYQQKHVKELTYIFKHIHNVALSASDTGTGKTVVALELARAIGFTVLCICPSAVQEQWRKEIVTYGVPCYSISTYNVLTRAKWTPMLRDGSLGTSRPFPKDQEFPSVKYSKKVYKSEGRTMKKDIYEWHLPPGTLIIMDESRTIKNKGTKRYNMCNSLIKCLNSTGKTSRLLFLSATAIESEKDLKTFLYMLGYISAPTAKSLKYFTSHTPLSRLQYTLYEDPKEKRGVMISTEDAKEELGIKIKSEIIPIVAIFSEEDANKIEQENKTIANIIAQDRERAKKDPKFGSDPMSNRLASFASFTRARQNIETIKLPAILDYAKKLIKEGYQTLVFLRFVKSIQYMVEEIGKAYGKKNVLSYYGEISKTDRLKATDAFNTAKIKCLIVSLQAGAEGINLHDISKGGKYPRATVSNPDPLLGVLYQALGRVNRISATSSSKQYLIFANTATERRFASKLREKDNAMKLIHGKRELALMDL